MDLTDNKTFGVIVSGVGGQGAITLAQLLLGAAWKAGLYTMQSEVHGMSQRGGSVNAQILMSKSKVTSPLILEGDADLLISMEPLETLRYINMMRFDSTIITSTDPVINMDSYPKKELILNSLSEITNVIKVDTLEHGKTLGFKQAGNMTLLGIASKYLPVDIKIWPVIISERFGHKGSKVIDKNIEAFNYGRNLKE